MRTNGEVEHDCAVESALRRIAKALESIASSLAAGSGKNCNEEGKETENV